MGIFCYNLELSEFGLTAAAKTWELKYFAYYNIPLYVNLKYNIVSSLLTKINNTIIKFLNLKVLLDI
jgi:hypothetical protein